MFVPDNLKAGVTSPCRYEPDLNPTYHDLARHYGVAVLPARVRKPKDKAKVEVGVQVVERWILARLRDMTFFDLADLNRALRALNDELNDRPMRHLGQSRRQLFETLDRPALKPLPTQPYELATWKKARVHIDYHVEFEKHFYSVPYTLIHQEVDVRATEHTIEIFYRQQRQAVHPRSTRAGASRRNANICRQPIGPSVTGHRSAFKVGLNKSARIRPTNRGGAGVSPSSATGLSHLSGHLALGQTLQRRAARSRPAATRCLRISAPQGSASHSRRPARPPHPDRTHARPGTADHANLRGPTYYH